jgi:hypothetical protein
MPAPDIHTTPGGTAAGASATAAAAAAAIALFTVLLLLQAPALLRRLSDASVGSPPVPFLALLERPG